MCFRATVTKQHCPLRNFCLKYILTNGDICSEIRYTFLFSNSLHIDPSALLKKMKTFQKENNSVIEKTNLKVSLCELLNSFEEIAEFHILNYII